VPVDIDGRIIVLETPTESFAKHITNTLAEKMREAILKADVGISDFRLKVEGSDDFAYNAPEEEEFTPPTNLNPNYTFDSFVVGKNNEFVYAAAYAVAKSPAGDLNPLFIYGGTGLGKTHLIQAIAHKVLKDNPDIKVIYVTCEQFVNEIIDNMFTGRGPDARDKSNKLRHYYRSADLLIIDDIQFIENKKAVQEEFFHTFNALYENRKQIVVTSDRPPREMFTLEERIKTRFVQGMIADVQPPEYELRLAILQKKAEKNNLNVPNTVLAFLAERLDSNIRQIEGALKKIGAVSFLSGRPITLEMVKSSIPEYFRENKPVSETVDNILEVTARKYDVTVEQILGKGRTKNIRTARNVSMYVIRKVLDLSLPQIGKMLDRDHSTVHSNIQAIEAEIQNNHRLNNEIVEIITEVKS